MACVADTALEQLFGFVGNNCRGQVRRVGLLRPALPTPRQSKRQDGACKRIVKVLQTRLSQKVSPRRVAPVPRKRTSQKLGGVTPTRAPCKSTRQKLGGVTPTPQKFPKVSSKVTTRPVQFLKAAHDKFQAAAEGAVLNENGHAACPPPDKKRRVDTGETRGIEDAVGRVDETVADHRERHPTLVSDCARCQWLQWGDLWRKKQGTSFVENCGRAERIEWIAERPARRGGLWGLGCSVCAHAANKLSQETGLRARGCLARVASKWARFEIRPASLQASHLVQHAGWQSHKLALEIYLAVDTPVREVIMDAAVLSEQDLLKGSVPQPADWLRAWRYMKEGTSFREASRACTPESYIHGTVSCPVPSRKAMKALQEVLVEKIREASEVG